MPIFEKPRYERKPLARRTQFREMFVDRERYFVGKGIRPYSTEAIDDLVKVYPLFISTKREDETRMKQYLHRPGKPEYQLSKLEGMLAAYKRKRPGY